MHANLGAFDLYVESTPSLMFIRENEFDSDKIISQIKQTDLPLKLIAQMKNVNKNDNRTILLENSKHSTTESHLIKVAIKFSCLP